MYSRKHYFDIYERRSCKLRRNYSEACEKLRTYQKVRRQS